MYIYILLVEKLTFETEIGIFDIELCKIQHYIKTKILFPVKLLF